MSQAGMQV